MKIDLEAAIKHASETFPIKVTSDLKEIKALSQDRKIKVFRCVVYFGGTKIPFPFSSVLEGCLGIDPGQVNMGFAFGCGREATIYQVKFPSKLGPVERLENTQILTHWILENAPIYCSSACVEYSAHGKTFGQSALAENRAAALLCVMVHSRFQTISVIPPLSIRKEVFGHGKIKAEEVWKKQLAKAPDGASALACALYAKKKYEKEKAVK